MRKRAVSWLWGVLPVLFALVPMLVAAQELPVLARQPVRRELYLAKEPALAVPEVFVAARTVTTLRFETPCDPLQTRLLGWEGRFEPLLVGGKSVVIVPLRGLALDDRFMLLVTLTDGTSLPFTVTAGAVSNFLARGRTQLLARRTDNPPVEPCHVPGPAPASRGHEA